MSLLRIWTLVQTFKTISPRGTPSSGPTSNTQSAARVDSFQGLLSQADSEKQFGPWAGKSEGDIAMVRF